MNELFTQLHKHDACFGYNFAIVELMVFGLWQLFISLGFYRTRLVLDQQHALIERQRDHNIEISLSLNTALEALCQPCLVCGASPRCGASPEQAYGGSN